MPARPRPVVLAAVLASCTLLAACGSSGGHHHGAASASGSASATVKAVPASGSSGVQLTPRADVKQGGTETMQIDQWIDQYNPYQVDGAEGDGAWLAELTLPHLFFTDAAGTPSPNPDVLVSAKVTATAPHQQVTYTINPKATWSDGTPITWKDFRQQWQDLNGRNAAYLITGSTGYDQISGVARGADDKQAVVTFSKPFGDWQQLFDPLIPAQEADTPAKFNKGWQSGPPVTAGPWKFGPMDKTTQTVTMVPDPSYWGTKPKLDKIVARVLDSDAVTQAYLNHELDVTTARTPDAYRSLKGAPDTSIRVGARWDQTVMSFGSGGLLADQTVRQALQHAIDRPALAKVAGTGLPFTPPVLNNHFYMPNQTGYADGSAGYGDYDPAAAKKLLDQAGWHDNGAGKPRTNARGQKLSLTYVVASGSTSSSQEAELVQNMLAQVGVQVRIQTVPVDDYFEKYVNVDKYDIAVFREVDQVYPSESIPDYQKPQGTNVFENYGQLGTAQIDSLMSEAAEQTDRTKAAALYNQADRALWQLANYLPLFQTPSIDAVTKNLVNEGAWGLLDPQQYVNTGYLN